MINEGIGSVIQRTHVNVASTDKYCYYNYNHLTLIIIVICIVKFLFMLLLLISVKLVYVDGLQFKCIFIIFTSFIKFGYHFFCNLIYAFVFEIKFIIIIMIIIIIYLYVTHMNAIQDSMASAITTQVIYISQYISQYYNHMPSINKPTDLMLNEWSGAYRI